VVEDLVEKSSRLRSKGPIRRKVKGNKNGIMGQNCGLNMGVPGFRFLGVEMSRCGATPEIGHVAIEVGLVGMEGNVSADKNGAVLGCLPVTRSASSSEST